MAAATNKLTSGQKAAQTGNEGRLLPRERQRASDGRLPPRPQRREKGKR